MGWIKSTDGKRMEWFPDEHFQLFLQERGFQWKRVGRKIRYWREVNNPEGAPMGERVHGEKRQPIINEALAAIIVAFDGGDMERVIRLFDEACEERFEAGISYAKDTVNEWHGR
jgi:hypothetical protein